MWIDPRIQGRLRELIESHWEERLKNPNIALEREREVLDYAKKGNNPFEIAYVKLKVHNLDFSGEGEFEAKRHIIEEVLSYAEIENDRLLIAEAKLKLAICCAAHGDYQYVEKLLLESIQQYKEDELHTMLWLALVTLGNFYILQNRYSEALAIAYRVKEGIENADPNLWSFSSLIQAKSFLAHAFGEISLKLHDYKKALEYFQHALDIAYENNQPRFIRIASVRIGVLHIVQGQYNEAAECFRSLLSQYQSILTPPSRVQILLGLSKALIHQGDLVEGEKILLEAEGLSTESGVKQYDGALIQVKGYIKLYRNDEDGIILLLKSLELTDHRLRLDAEQISVLHEIAAFYKKKNDFEHALEYEEKYVKALEVYRDETQLTILKLHEHEATDRIAHEKLIFEKDKEILNLELEKKQAELSMQATQLVTQTELLARFRDELREIVRKAGTTDATAALKEVKEKLKELPCKQIDWEKFETEFKAVHPEFMHKLYERYPALTPMEVKMCSLLRLALKSQEIARLFCVTERAVEFHRLNIRKKCGIPKEQSLSAFLNNL